MDGGYLFATGEGRRHRSKLSVLSESQNHRCCYCGVRFVDALGQSASASIEHVVRLCDGGKRTWDNEVAACRRCNSSRGDLPAEVFFAVRELVVPEMRARRRRHGHANRKRVQGWKAAQRAADPVLAVVVRVEAKTIGTLADVWPQP